MNYKLYVKQNIERWRKLCEDDYANIEKCDFHVIEEGYILPLLADAEDEQITDARYRGGVCDKQGNFVAGLVRKYYDLKMNYSIYDAYQIAKEEIQRSEEEVIFGGLVFAHFGHCITETMSRLWYLVEDKSDRKIAFLCNGEVPEFFWILMELLQIDRERICFVDKPMGFSKIMVPDQAFVMFGGFYPKYACVYETMAKNAVRQEIGVGKKVYLSRSRFKKQDCINESYFEAFYQNRGYAIVYPEQESLQKQIAIIREADEVVCTAGTLGHLLLFAKQGTKLTMLLRENSPGAIKPQIICNQVKGIECIFVDVSYSFLPGSHAWNVFLLGPTPSFLEYVAGEGMSFFSEAEEEMDWSSVLHPYIMNWLELHSSNNEAYKVIHNQDIFDVINRMNIILKGVPLRRKEMPTVPRDNNIYVPRDLQLIDVSNQAKEHISIAKFKWDSGSIAQQLKEFAKISSDHDLVQIEDDIHEFGFSEKEMKLIYGSTVDVVFWERSGKIGSIAERFLAEHGHKSWDVMIGILRNEQPEYYKESKWVFENNILYPYNTFIMKKTLFSHFVGWLIPMIEEIENWLEEEEKKLLPFLAEQLLTLYFESGRNKCVIALREKRD